MQFLNLITSVLTRYTLYLAGLYFLLGTTAHAQYDYLLNKSYGERCDSLWSIGEAIHGHRDTAGAFSVTKPVIRFAQLHHDAALELEMELYEAYFLMCKSPKLYKDRTKVSLENIITRSIDAGSTEVGLKARTVLAEYYWTITHEYELALEEYKKMERLLTIVSVDQYPEKTKILFEIGNAHFYFKDYNRAIYYFRQVPEMKKEVRFLFYSYVHSLCNMAISYRELGNIDYSDHYLGRLFAFCTKKNDPFWVAIVKGYQGYNQFLRGNLDAAIPLVNACSHAAIAIKDHGLASTSQLWMAEILFKKKDLKAAAAATLKAQEYVQLSGQYFRNRHLYPLLSKMYAHQGNAKLAGLYTDSTLLVLDSLDKSFSGLLMARAIQKDALEQRKKELSEEANARSLLNLKFYTLLIAGLLVLTGTIYIYRMKRRQHQQEKKIQELQLEAATTALDHARAQLDDFTRHLAEKNRTIEAMQASTGQTRVLEELENSVILTGTDWRKFSELFEKVYPGFLQQLPEKVPGITPAEIRLLALAKLNFSNKEMAYALAVTPQAIRVTWHRLRKKINLPESETIEDLLQYCS